MSELINILIRTSNRPEQFKRCLQSVVSQNYDNIRIIVSADREVNYIPAGLELIKVSADKSLPYFYDCYCNDLKSLVNEGWFMFLDDDDILVKNVLSQIELNHKAIIHQLQRQSTIVPKDLNFKRGLIGMPCLMLHHSLKNLADIPGTGCGDYVWVSEVMKRHPVVFRELITVYSFGRGLGL
jgi:cellulose synthase/poly-beta-1,6-N-acetylglucosamine synthase-like glycosyltransferase